MKEIAPEMSPADWVAANREILADPEERDCLSSFLRFQVAMRGYKVPESIDNFPFKLERPEASAWMEQVADLLEHEGKLCICHVSKSEVTMIDAGEAGMVKRWRRRAAE